MKTSKVKDNSGHTVIVIADLVEGQELRAKVDTTTLDDIGMSMLTFECPGFIKGEIYPVNNIYSWKGVNVAYVVDETGCCNWATPDIFEFVEEKSCNDE